MKIKSSTHPLLVKALLSIYPEYKGRKFYIESLSGNLDATSYWDGGSRDYFVFVRLDGKLLRIPEESPWDQTKDNRTVSLVPGLCCARHSIFCGTDCGITLLVHPEDLLILINNQEYHNRVSDHTKQVLNTPDLSKKHHCSCDSDSGFGDNGCYCDRNCDF